MPPGPPTVLALTTEQGGSFSLLLEDGGQVECQTTPITPGTVVEPFSVVLRPGGVPGNNVFTTWAALYAATAAIAGGVRCVFDDTLAPIVIPANPTPYGVDNWIFEAESSFTNPEDGAIVTFADGAELSFGRITLGAWLTFQTAAAATPVVSAGAGQALNVIMEPFSVIMATGAAPFFDLSGTSYLWIDGTNAILGDGVHSTIRTNAVAGNGQANFHAGLLSAGCITGAGLAAWFIFADANTGVSVGGTIVTFVDDATRVTFTPTTATNWGIVPAQTGPALDTIASAAANHGQATSAVAGPANPLDSTALACTPRVSGKVRVWASTTCLSAGIDDLIQATLLLDGGAVAGAPTPQMSATLAGDKVTLVIEWDVTTTLAAHTLQIRASGAAALTGTQQVVKFQELLA
jgi:hypothetical protein